MSEDRSPGELLELLQDEYARAILEATSTQPMSAKTLSEICDASLPTVYRRVERLVEADLLAERTELSADGNHFAVYEARLDRLVVDLSDGELSVSVRRTETDIADRFTDLWEGI